MSLVYVRNRQNGTSVSDSDIKLWSSCIISVFLALEVIGYFFEDKTFFDITFAFMGLGVLAYQIKFVLRRHHRIFLLFTLAAAFSFFSMYAFQGKVTTVPLRLMMQFSMLILVLRYGVRPRHILILTLAYMGLVIFLHFVSGVSLGDIFPTASENIVGWMALALAGFYYMLSYAYKRPVKAWFAIVVFLFAILCVGRATIVGSAILMFGVLFYKFYKGGIWIKFVLIALASIFTIVMVKFGAVIDLINAGFRKFNTKGLSLDHRDIIIQGYLEKLNLTTIFSGVSPDQSPFLKYSGNFHNSYLLAHSHFGFFAFILFALIIVGLVKNAKSNPFLCAVFLALAVRLFTDIIAFTGIFDFVIFFGIYLLVTKKYPNTSFGV